MKNTKHVRITGICLIIGILMVLLCGFSVAGLSVSSVAYAENDISFESSISEIRGLLEPQSGNSNISIEVFNEDGSMQIMQYPEIEEYNQEFASVQSLSTTPSFVETKILDSGKPDSESIVITYMGDGFTATQQTTFINAVRASVDSLLGNSTTGLVGCYPFNLFKDVFTVYAIQVISNESGVSRDPLGSGVNSIVDNYFGSSFFGKNGNRVERALEIKHYSRANDLVKPYSAMCTILCNSTNWGGTGGEYAVSSLASGSERIVIHEFGHSFGELADEYYYPSDGPFSGREAANMTGDGDPTTVKWNQWIGYKSVGVYPYSSGVSTSESGFDATSHNWFRPHQNCTMRYSSSPFCPVCAATLSQKMEQKAGAIFNTTNIGTDSIQIDHLNFSISGRFEIPERINGRIVTVIGDSAFKDQQNCNEIIMPSTVVSIGNQAFKNCSSLATISAIPNIQSIGSEAFKGCLSLTYIYLPSSLVSIGSQAFVNCSNLFISMSTSNPNYSVSGNILYNKTKTTLFAACNISHTINIPTTVLEIMAYAFEGNNKLQTVYFEQSSNIGESAFANCANLGSAYFDSHTLPNLGDNSFANDSFVLYTPYVMQVSYGLLFAEYTNSISSISVNITLISDNTIVDTLYVNFGSNIADLYVPIKTGYDFLGWYDNNTFIGMQYQNGSLWETKVDLSLYAKWTPKQYNINYAGEQSEALTSKVVVYDAPIGTLPLLTRTGYSFIGWKAPNGQYYNENTIWTETSNLTLTSDWSANEYIISYNANGGTVSEIEQNVIYDDAVETLATCIRAGYSFLGWNTAIDGGEQYIVAPFIYNTNTNMTLYAQWQLIEYSITYNLNGGTNVSSNPISYTVISENITFNSPEKIGYTFVNWKYGETTIIGIPTGSFGNVNITAYWSPNQYLITLDPNGGINNGIDTLIATFDVSFATLTIPTKPGYTFEGWFDNSGLKYIAADGNCTRLWDKTSDTTLYAHWAIKSYEIRINNDGSITWLGANGLSNEQCSIEYGTSLVGLNLVPTFRNSSQGYKEGQIFDHFEFEGSNIAWSNVPDLGNDGEIIIILPVWIAECHTIYFNTLTSTTFDELTANYAENITLHSNISRAGYTFNGWYTSAIGGTKVVWTTMPDLTLGSQSNGSITIFAHYDVIQYSVTYNLDGGVNSALNPSTYNIESIFSLQPPSKTGYSFGGWFLDAGKTQAIIELRNSSGNKQIYAKWTPNSYMIKFYPNGGVGSVQESTHTYNISKSLMANTFSKIGNSFAGWATSTTGSIVYSNSQQVVNLSSENNFIINLYARWNPHTYQVSYNANGGQGTMEPTTHTYDVASNLRANAFTNTGYHFAGWATSTTGGISYTNSQSVINLTTENQVSVILYAKWSPNTYTILLDNQSGTGGTNSVTAIYGNAMPTASAPTRTGYTFQGYYTQQNGNGIKYYNANMTSVRNWTTLEGTTLYAYWTAGTFTITFNKQGGSGGTDTVIATYGSILPSATKPTKIGHDFQGYYTQPDGSGTAYYSSTMSTSINWDIASNTTLYAKWEIITKRVGIHYITGAVESPTNIATGYTEKIMRDSSVWVSAPNIDGYSFYCWAARGGYPKKTPYVTTYSNSSTIEIPYSYLTTTLSNYRNYDFYAMYRENSCVAEGTLITLADGRLVPVESLTGNENLLVWNMLTGQFDSAPILFIDSDPVNEYEVINLSFSDGTETEVIYEHAFWDFDLNKYVFLRNDAAQYIGHSFMKQQNNIDGILNWTVVTLVDVTVEQKQTTAWSPVTYGHLCYFVNGMLSMPGATEGLINIFDVIPFTLQYDEVAYNADIEEYGLFTYEEFTELITIPEFVFEAFSGQYLKVSIGKGLITVDELIELVARYTPFFVEE